jgi:hypothetical protein
LELAEFANLEIEPNPQKLLVYFAAGNAPIQSKKKVKASIHFEPNTRTHLKETVVPMTSFVLQYS